MEPAASAAFDPVLANLAGLLPTLKEMAAHRLIVRENVVLEQGNLD